MTEVYRLDQIRAVLAEIDVITAMEAGFVAYSQGKAVIPPVGELILKDPPGDAHIKYGYIEGDSHYVIKIASGFYENFKLGIPSSQGLMLLFSRKTGQTVCILLDEGHLTDVRTAAAGAVAAKYLAPERVERIGILGAGIQGRLQLQYLSRVRDCRDVMVWGVNDEELKAYREEMSVLDYRVETTRNAADIPASCNLIVTCTPSKRPLLAAAQIRSGTHITAMGSDTSEKIELDPEILKKADIVVADSIQQCLIRGEIHQALEAQAIPQEKVRELGHVISQPALGRTSDEQITIVDLTGVAVQDIKISTAVFKALQSPSL
jgi:ornithine cyclodeaminase